ncbi:MAG: hypothetical protein OIF47_14215 [Marinibacterium sp.]|nr:hypothetical protein [Marinibacterium sp.]
MTEPLATFRPDRGAYLRSHTWMAALAMALAMLVLWLIGNPYVWTGAPAGLLAIGVRGWYLASEELAVRWQIADDVLAGAGVRIPLGQIDKINTLGSMVQVVTRDGHKHLIKYQADPAATVAAIKKATG